MMSKLINSNDYHLFVTISKVLHQVEWVQETENRWFLHFNYDFFLEIMFLLMVSVYKFKAFSNHQTPTPLSAPSHVQGLRKCRLDVQEMFTPPVVPEHICQATLPDQSQHDLDRHCFRSLLSRKNIHMWSLFIAYHM